MKSFSTVFLVVVAVAALAVPAAEAQSNGQCGHEYTKTIRHPIKVRGSLGIWFGADGFRRERDEAEEYENYERLCLDDLGDLEDDLEEWKKDAGNDYAKARRRCQAEIDKNPHSRAAHRACDSASAMKNSILDKYESLKNEIDQQRQKCEDLADKRENKCLALQEKVKEVMNRPRAKQRACDDREDRIGFNENNRAGSYDTEAGPTCSRISGPDLDDPPGLTPTNDEADSHGSKPVFWTGKCNIPTDFIYSCEGTISARYLCIDEPACDPGGLFEVQDPDEQDPAPPASDPGAGLFNETGTANPDTDTSSELFREENTLNLR